MKFILNRVTAIEEELSRIKDNLPVNTNILSASANNYTENNIVNPVVEPGCSYQYSEKLKSNNKSFAVEQQTRPQEIKLNQYHNFRQNAIEQKRRAIRNRPKPAVGKCKNDVIRGECRKTDLFLYRVSKETESSEIQKFFENSSIKLYAFEQVSHVDARMKSFKIKVALDDVQKICNPDFLPEEVMCRKFFAPKPKPPPSPTSDSEDGGE